MVETHLKWVGHVWRRPIGISIKRVDQMEGSMIISGRERFRKTRDKINKKDLVVRNFVYEHNLRFSIMILFDSYS